MPCGLLSDLGDFLQRLADDFLNSIDFGKISDRHHADQFLIRVQNEQPPLSDSALGSKDYSRLPVAIILGGGYDDASTDLMMKAAAGIKPIPWLRPDLTKPAPPLGPEYGKVLVARVKELLARLEKEGKMNEEKVHWY